MASQVKPASTEAFFKPPREFGERSPNGFPIGKRTRRRQSENAKLNKLGIKHCEIRLKGCLGNKMLTWAHSKKSRFLVTSKDWQEAARACLWCHDKIEAMGHKEMHRLVTQAIKNRGNTDK